MPTAGPPRVVMISGQAYPYFVWDGRTLPGTHIGFETETALIVVNRVPALALAAASSGTEHCLVHPDRLGEFLLRHADRHLVLHNVAFDFWVVAGHLSTRGEAEALGAWWDSANDDRMHDTMLLDALIRLARTDDHPRPRDLGEVARDYAGLAIDKGDAYRLRYGEIIGEDWEGFEEGFFAYAVKDAIATLQAFRVMVPKALRLMEEHGYDPARRG